MNGKTAGRRVLYGQARKDVGSVEARHRRTTIRGICVKVNQCQRLQCWEGQGGRQKGNMSVILMEIKGEI